MNRTPLTEFHLIHRRDGVYIVKPCSIFPPARIFLGIENRFAAGREQSALKENFLAKATRKMDIPANLVGNQPKIVITGFHDLYIDNHQGLLEYGEREVHINCGEAVLRLQGEGFVIRAMSAAELRIEGLIFSLGFEY